MSSRRQRSQLMEATPLHLHSLRRERTGMTTTCGRNEKAPLHPLRWGIEPQEGSGPQALL
jgi:hypothetical protein